MENPAIVPFSALRTEIPGLVVVHPKQVADRRGVVREFFRESAMGEAGLPAGPWRQLNVTETAVGVIRGLHGEPSTKLVTVIAGVAYGAYVDTRPDSPARGRVVAVELALGTQVVVPPGVCSGFQAVGSAPAQYLYAVDREWAPGLPRTAVHPLDPALGIEWPIAIDRDDRGLLSAADAGLPPLAVAIAA